MPDPLPRPRPADWKLPAGVAPGTWDYTHTAEIANGYDAFLSGTSLTTLDLQLLDDLLPRANGEDEIVGDLGCGTGRTLGLIRGHGYRMLGIDLSQPMLRCLQRRADASSDKVMAVRANLVTLDCLVDQSLAHAVCLFSTLGMVSGRANRRRVIAHTHRLLRPNGRFLLHAHNRWSSLRDPGGTLHLMRSWWNSMRAAEADFGDRTYAYRGLPNMFLHSYGRGELIADLRSGGFVVDKVIPLTIRGDQRLPAANWLPGLRAGGFIAVARRPAGTAS